VTRSYYRGAAGVILVYDITKLVHLLIFTVFTLIVFTGSRDSFLNMSQWLTDARALGSPHLVAVLVGNKSDKEDEREVEWAEASRWAAENGESSVFRCCVC
jgi:GTPase SAR1 family protein